VNETIPATGIIGCGHMGSAIARCILDRGRPLAVHDIRPEAVAELAARGAVVYPGPAALAAACDVVLLSLPSHTEVAEVVSGERGVLGSLRPGAVLVSLTTGSVRTLPALADACRQHGTGYVTAPVSQGVRNAELGRLTVFAAGSQDGYDAVLPVLRAFASTVLYFGGDHRSAMAAKLVSNLAWFVNAAALGELMALAARSGIPPGQFRDVMAASCGDSWVIRNDVPSVLDGSYDPSFTTALACKDLDLAAELAGLAGVPLTMGQLAAELFDRAQLTCGPDSPELSVVRLAEEDTGVQLGPRVLRDVELASWGPALDPPLRGGS
jgi:3-hydroxyisobutyrate dehydrogenase